MKRSGRCPKCESPKIGHLSMVPDLSADPGGLDPAPTSPQYAGVVVIQRAKPGFFGSAEKLGLAGELEAFVCTACGHYEAYVKDPGKVPFEKMKGFEWYEPGDG